MNLIRSSAGLLRAVACRWNPFLAALLVCTGGYAEDATLPAPVVSPWTHYNAAVLTYSRKDYAKALQRWQDLSLQKLPGQLQRQVWFQLGNTEFHLGEPFEQDAPEQAAELWRRSCEDYHLLLADRPRDADARHNLELVQHRLAQLLHRLGNESFAAAKGKPVDPAIDLLRASVDSLNEAVSLTPQDPPLRADRDLAERTLRERMIERAARAESKGDDDARQNNSWADQNAEENYRAALEDLGNARREPAKNLPARAPDSASPKDPINQTVARAEERVNEKLAELLTRMGQHEQKQGNEQATWNPDDALDHYEDALEQFQNAQQAQPHYAAAERGEREVRTAMEQLQVRAGQDALKQGRQELARQSPEAAPTLSAALAHFQSALDVNPQNGEARAGADEAQRLLPDALALTGQEEMREGDRAGQYSVSEALNEYQQSQSDFEQALGLNPGQKQARNGLRELEPKLARMRERMSKEGDGLTRQNQPGNRPPESLQSLLGQVSERMRTPQLDRQRQAARKFTGIRKNYPDW